MTIGRGIAWIYDHMTRGLPEEAVDEIDAALGDQAAVARVQQNHMQILVAAGGEIG